jgi:hypothetical protein
MPNDLADEASRKTDCPADLQGLKAQAQHVRNSAGLQDSARQSSTSGSMPESLVEIRDTALEQAEPRLRLLKARSVPGTRLAAGP